MSNIHDRDPHHRDMHLHRGGVLLRPDPHAHQRGQFGPSAGDSREAEVLEVAHQLAEDYACRVNRQTPAEPDLHNLQTL
jgi:hypothetical protein